MDTVDLLAAVIRGDRSVLAVIAQVEPEVVGRAAREHGVLSLVAERLQDETPSSLSRSLAEEANRAAVEDMRREVDLRQLLADFSRERLDVLVFKGGQLAYSHYARPDLRYRSDTDLLIAPASRTRANDVLIGLGYRVPHHVNGDFVIHQGAYLRYDGDAMVHVIDLHWRIANPQVFADLLTFEELWLASVPMPNLGPAARGLSNVHALFVACVHRVAHHADSDCLIWLYDLHLIASRLTNDEWQAFLDLAGERGVVVICRHSLERAAQRFGTPIPRAVLDDSRLNPATHANEATAAYLNADRRPVDNFLTDVRTLPRWTDRLKLIREHLFPPSVYMHRVYAPASKAPLPWLYAQRALRGARKWIARP